LSTKTKPDSRGTVKGDDGGDRDGSFGRWAGTLYHEGKNVNAEMIRAGHAVAYDGRLVLFD